MKKLKKKYVAKIYFSWEIVFNRKHVPKIVSQIKIHLHLQLGCAVLGQVSSLVPNFFCSINLVTTISVRWW